MSSAATRARSEGVRGRGRSRGAVREIHFKVLFHLLKDEIKLEESQTVKDLKSKIAASFRIPITKQFIYGEGWPEEDPEDSVKLKDLGLPATVELFIAANGTFDVEPPLEPDADGARPGTSRELNTSPPSGSILERSESMTCQLHVMDQKNGEMYDELPFDGNQSVQEIKNFFADLTGIPIEFQEWSGWPDDVYANLGEQLFLKDIGLDKPFHSLVLKDLRENDCSTSDNAPRSTGENDNSSPSASVGQNDNNTSDNGTRSAGQNDSITSETGPNTAESDTSSTNVSSSLLSIGEIEPESTAENGTAERREDAPVPVPKKRAVARKSTSRAAMNEVVRRRNQSTSSSDSMVVVNNEENLTFDSSSQRSLDDNLPSTSGSSFHSTTNNDGRSREERKRPGTEGSSEFLSPKKSRTNHSPSKLLMLPEKAIKLILPQLDPLTVLSLRRACKGTRAWVSNDKLFEHTQKSEEEWKKFRLSVTGNDDKTFETAVNMNLPISRFIFEVTDETFYDRTDIDSFISFYSLRVKEVILRKCFMFQNNGERKLFESFMNLEKLTIDELVLLETRSTLPCPRTLANLQVLKLNYAIAIPQDNVLGQRPKCWDMTWSMLSDCTSLLYFRFPKVIERRVKSISNNFGIFAPLLDYISIRVRSGGVALEYLDLKHFNNPDSFYINRFVDLIRRCYKKDIKMKNVNSLVIQQVLDEDGSISDDKYKFCENITSLVNYCPFVENAPLRNLEKLIVDVIPSITNYETLGKSYKDIFWPKLRVIKIKDSEPQDKTDRLWRNWQQVQEDLYGFNGIFDRGNVQYIKIDSPKLPYFLSEGRLAKKFYNLKRLEIVNWCSTGDDDMVLDKRLHAIWKKLGLEELRIENCPRLSDSSFIGEEDEADDDSVTPFLKLTPTLKKLTLGLDGTQVTDRSLIKVFSKMKIKTFILLSSEPTMISEPGLLKLHQREFGRHIEYFPFDCWSSSSIDPRRFKRLGKSFRSFR